MRNRANESQTMTPACPQLRPTDAFLIIEEFTLEAQALQQPLQTKKIIMPQIEEIFEDNMTMEQEECSTAKRSYKEFCLGGEDQPWRISSNLCYAHKKPQKRINA